MRISGGTDADQVSPKLTGNGPAGERPNFTLEVRQAVIRETTPLRTFGISGKLAVAATSDGPVIEAFYMMVGVIVAILLDWAIYTHLSAYLRIGFPSTRDASYRDIAIGSSTHLIRTSTVATTGMTAGLAFALELGWLWLVAVALFALVHSLAYAFLYNRGEQP